MIQQVRFAGALGLVAVAAMHPASADGRTWSDGAASSIRVPGSSMMYRYYLPKDYDSSREYPLLLYLHGAGERGSDNRTQVGRSWVSHLIQRTEEEYPAILVAPQVRRGSWSPENPDDHVDLLLAKMLTDFSIDENRLYITGASMGSFGTFSYLDYYNYRQPDQLQFAAAAALAGAWLPDDSAEALDALREVPLWLMHGDADGTVSVESSRSVFGELAGSVPFDHEAFGHPTAIAGNTRYTELSRRGHDIWSIVYSDAELYDWMFAQTLAIPEPAGPTLFGAALLTAACAKRKKMRGRR